MAVAASVEEKWVDNLLARFVIPGVDRAGQGVARRISVVGLKHVLLIRWLTTELSLPLSRAVDCAIRALASPDGVIAVGQGLEIRVDLARLSTEAELLVADAVESIVPVRRGRPPRSGPRLDPE